MFPKATDLTQTTRDVKKAQGQRFFDNMEAATPTLNRFGVKNPHPTNSPKAQTPIEGQTGQYKGTPVIFTNGKWKRR